MPVKLALDHLGAGDFDRGMTQGVAALAGLIEAEHAGGGPSAIVGSDDNTSRDGPIVAKVLLAIGGGLTALFGGIAGRRRWRRRRPRLPSAAHA
jgi:hypothetical protein